MADLHRVQQHVLSIAGAVMEPSQHFYKLRMEIPDAAFKHHALTLCLDGRFHLPAGLFHHLFDVGGMNPAVGNQLFQRQPGNLPPYRFKAADGDRLRRVVNNQIHARQRFNGADIAALAADDSSLHLVIGQGNHTDGHFSHGISGAPLDGLGHHFPGAGLALLLHPGLHLFDLEGSLVSHLRLHLINQILFRFLSGKAGDSLQHLRLAALDHLDLFIFFVHGCMLLRQGLLFLFNGLRLAVQVFLLLLQTVFLSL